MAKLVIKAGPDQGREFPLGQTQVIGRLGRNEITIHDSGASREHARVARRGDDWVVLDLNSKNGIVVNGAKVPRSVLKPGDELLVGTTLFTLVGGEAAESAASGAAGERKGRITARSDISFRTKGGTSATSTRVVRSRHKQDLVTTRTTLAWLRSDLAQVGGAYKALLVIGLIVMVLGLGYLAFTLTAG